MADKARVFGDNIEGSEFFRLVLRVNADINFRRFEIGRDVRLRHGDNARQSGLLIFETGADNLADLLLIFAVQARASRNFHAGLTSSVT